MFRWEGPSEGAWKGVNGSIWKGREGVSGVLERGSEYTWTGNVRRGIRQEASARYVCRQEVNECS